jgi:hypothetical protein
MATALDQLICAQEQFLFPTPFQCCAHKLRDRLPVPWADEDLTQINCCSTFNNVEDVARPSQSELVHATSY